MKGQYSNTLERRRVVGDGRMHGGSPLEKQEVCLEDVAVSGQKGSTQGGVSGSSASGGTQWFHEQKKGETRLGRTREAV